MKRLRLFAYIEGLENPLLEIYLEVPLSCTLADLKRRVQNQAKLPVASIFYRGRHLQDNTFVSPSKQISLSWTCPKTSFRLVSAETCHILYDRGESNRLNDVLQALRSMNRDGLKVKRDDNSAGSGGLYFLKINTPPQIVACFKPREDEPGSPNNPNYARQREGVRPGESAERETAAFALDWHGFCGVPGTVLVEATADVFRENNSPNFYRNKIGSFQAYVQNAYDFAGDYSPHLFSAREVHKIGILDIRFLNLDRNDSNILVVKQSTNVYHLVPIDHGLCFPDQIEIAWCDWVWWDWPQTLVPFDEQTKEWILSIDVNEDARILEQCFNIRPECIRLYRCMMLLLKKGVSAGLTLREIASVVVRTLDLQEPSALEKTIERATELATMMDSNSRNKTKTQGQRLHRSSSFDGNLSPKIGDVPESLFLSYVDRLLEDVVAEINLKKQFSFSRSSSSESGWFSVSQRSSPTELTKIASPRLLPLKRELFTQDASSSGGISSFSDLPDLSLH